MAHKYLKPKKKSFKRFLIPLVLLVIVVCGLLMFVLGKGDTKQQDRVPSATEVQQNQAAESAQTQTAEAAAVEGLTLLMPWEADGAKQPAEYTLEEYEGLTADQRKAFLNHLGAADYAAWLERAEAEAEKDVVIPWKESGAKKPEDYTWADYQALTAGQQKAFMEALGPQGLEVWLQKVQGGNGSQSGSSTNSSQSGSKPQSGSTNQTGGNSGQSSGSIQGADNTPDVGNFYPWEKSGAKKAENYTWEDYDALSSPHKTAFRYYLNRSAGGYEKWLEKVLYPWKTVGAKQPMDYSWEEYKTLTKKQQEKFQEALGTKFTTWQRNAIANTPWLNPGAKQPEKYTWADYEGLSEAQQGTFQNHLGEDGMKTWLRKITDIPWDGSNAKQPEKYTLKEYEALKAPQKLAFQIDMGLEEFSDWLIEAKNPEENPWDKAGAKQPKEYTWEEYNALTSAQQMAFQNKLGAKEFDNWRKQAEGKPAANPWEVAGAKQPKDYTLKEYNNLKEAEQMAFQKHLGSAGFADWLSKVQEKPVEVPVVNPWDVSGAKQPKDYSWADFNNLTTDQQMAFQNHMGAGFESWMNSVQGGSAANPWDEAGAKQPADYTMEEFEKLTGAQSIAFQNHLGSAGFESWMNRVQEKTEEDPEENPWDVSGSKQPADYTMEEFEELTGAQQIAFQNHLGSTGFEAWLNKVSAKPTEEATVESTVEAMAEQEGNS